MRVDLNCDLGEAFGNYSFGGDHQIIPLITSANVACGFHAGDENVMNETVKLAKAHNVAVGAHPGLPDLKGFGRRNIDISNDEIYNLMIYQLGHYKGFVAFIKLKLIMLNRMVHCIRWVQRQRNSKRYSTSCL